MQTSILLTLRTAAMNCTDTMLTERLRIIADEMSGHLTLFCRQPNASNIIDVNGCWARAEQLLKLVNLISPPPSGTPAVIELARAA